MPTHRLHRSLILTGMMLGVAMCITALLNWSRAATAVAQPSTVPLASSDAATCVGDNLLTNPGFEGDYTTYIYPPPGHPDCQTWNENEPNQFCERAKMPAGWHPRWLEDGAEEFIVMPEFTASTPDQVNPDRVRSGEKSLHYWSFWLRHEAAVFQQVTAVPGVAYCFSAWGHAWSDRNSDDFFSATADRPIDDGQLYQRVGIDPTGGTDWQADTVIWSDARKQYDLFGEFVISATAESDQITVFLYSTAGVPVKHNDVYWDDAALTAATLNVASGGRALMTTLSNTLTTTTHIPIQITNPAYTWTAVLDPNATLTPTLSASSGSADDSLTITTTTTGLPLGVYTTTLTITTTPTALGSPAHLPFAIYIVDDIYPVFLPVITKP